MDRNGEDWSGDDISQKASAPGGARDDAAGEKPANADEGADPQKDIDQQAGKGPERGENMTPYPGPVSTDEDRHEEGLEEKDD